ncbi:MAG: VacB/RNase II family 3'-5' exoribonuclease, partial [Eudoraea sp.]
MSKKKKRAKSHKKNEITKGIFNVLEKEPSKSFNYKQVASKLELIDTESRNLLIRRLGELKNEKRILENTRGKYQAITNGEYYQGKVDITARGNAYVVVDELENDIFVPYNRINRAFHGDIVEVDILNKKSNKKPEGEIKKILERKKKRFVGIVDLQKTFAFIRPTDIRMYTDIFIPPEGVGKAKNGEKVLVEIIEWPDKAESPYGKIIEILGKPGEHHTEIHAILAEYGLPSEFPAEVENFANTLDTSIKEEEILKRKDLRELLTFTIDPKDAKDFDDALSFEILQNGNFSIGIHIADVSHYLKPDTVLEQEAYERATSVYLVDRVVPMLPEVLSNNACSLRPHEDKYTFSAIFEIDEHCSVKNQWFGRTVINSNERFAYEEAQYIIETGEESIPESVSIRNKAYTVGKDTVYAINTLNSLAKKMRIKRMDSGAISFDKVEVKFNLNAENEPQGVYFKESKDSNKLIEEFMLLANRKVAEFIGKQKPTKTFVYRIHDQPDEEKLLALNNIISRFGHKLNLRDKKAVNSSLNKLLEDVRGKKEQNLVDTLAIRSMSKAIYSTDNIGHYGLAFDFYSHFTSPI